jgi:predicted aspartyl protease
VLMVVMTGFAHAGEPITFSFIQNTSLVAVSVMVNGSGPYRFLLDTGASNSILSATVADRLKIKAGREHTLLTGGGNIAVTLRTIRLQVGETLLENLEIVVTNFPLMRSLEVDGILGADYLRRFKVAIDYEKRVVELESATDRDVDGRSS